MTFQWMAILVMSHVGSLSARSPARPTASAGKANRLDDPWANQMESQVVDFKKAHPNPEAPNRRLRLLGH